MIGRDLGLARIPELCTTDARVTPMVWWTGGKVRVLIPAFLLADLSREELRGILARELAHVRRRDHLVRWLEWLVCSAFWWNPVAWWARHQLRIAEESCCDQLALDVGTSCPRTYANALLRVVASASESPGFRPPLPVSAAGGVGRTKVLERRLRMIVSTDPADGAALDSPAKASAAVHEFVDLLSRREAEIQERIREAMESGSLSERRGRELSAYVSGAASGSLIRYGLDNDISDEDERAASSRLIEQSVGRTRGLWTGDYSSRMSNVDLSRSPSPELATRLDELLRQVVEIERARNGDESSGEWARGRTDEEVELLATIRAALGHEIERSP